MARLDVFQLANGAVALDCQSDLLDHLRTRFTVPMLPAEDVPSRLPGLHPSFTVDGGELVMGTHFAGTIPSSALTMRIGTLAGHELAVQRALDMLSGSY